MILLFPAVDHSDVLALKVAASAPSMPGSVPTSVEIIQFGQWGQVCRHQLSEMQFVPSNTSFDGSSLVPTMLGKAKLRQWSSLTEDPLPALALRLPSCAKARDKDRTAP